MFTTARMPAHLHDASSWKAPSPGHAVTLIDVLTQLAYRKWLIAKVTGIAILVGVTMCVALPVRYTATTKIMPPQQTQSTYSMMMSQLSNIGGGSLAAVAGGFRGEESERHLRRHAQPPPIADALIRQFGLAKVYRARDMTAARMRLARLHGGGFRQERLYRSFGYG